MITLLRTRFTHHIPLPTTRSFSSSPIPKIVPLEPGLLTIKHGLSREEQITLSNIALQAGETGFWRIDPQGNRTLNSAPHRGRIYQAVRSYPPIVGNLCRRSIELAAKTDTAIKVIDSTHLILLYYKTLAETPSRGFIPWHQDNGENDGEDDMPVVSFNIGDSCDFLVNRERPKVNTSHPLSNPANLAHRILFESGDVVIFGGPSRLIWHTIYKIHQNTAPKFLPFQNARLNFTFRYTPKLLGDEARFATQEASKLPKDNQFYKTTQMK